MKKNVTIDDAISRGHWMLTYPSMIFLFGSVVLSLGLSDYYSIPPWGYVLIIVLGFGLSFLSWGVMVTKWRLWAFEHVRNVHELKKRAIIEGLIFRDYSTYENLEIRSTTDRKKWAALQYKFKQEDVFEDDSTIEEETVIGYSASNNIFELLIMLVVLGIGIYAFLASSYVFGILMVTAGGYFAFKEFKEATNTEPQIVLNSKGIKTVSAGFYKWSQIRNENVVREGSGNYSINYLVYWHPQGVQRLQIDEFDTDMVSLNKLLILYRGRSKHLPKSK